MSGITRTYAARLIGPIPAHGIAVVKEKCAEHGIEYVESCFTGITRRSAVATPNNPKGVEQQPLRMCLVCMDLPRDITREEINEYFKKAFPGLPVLTATRATSKDTP